MARPQITLSEDQVREVETLAALLSQDQIADYLGVSRSTLRAICDRDAEVLERYKRGKAKAIAHVANGLLQKARSGDTTSAIDDVPGRGVAHRGPRAFKRAELVSRSVLQAG